MTTAKWAAVTWIGHPAIAPDTNSDWEFHMVGAWTILELVRRQLFLRCFADQAVVSTQHLTAHGLGHLTASLTTWVLAVLQHAHWLCEGCCCIFVDPSTSHRPAHPGTILPST